MKPTQKELTNWAISKIQKDFRDDIALLIAVPGLSMKNDCHGECFDYFIPANENGNKLAQTFIIDGVGHDLYPRSWERIEKMAELQDDFTCGLGEATILYCRKTEDKDRFLSLQEILKSNLANKTFMFQRSLEKLDIAMDLYRTMMFEDALYKVRMAAGYIANYLSIAVACINGTYFKRYLEPKTIELSHMKKLPENYIAYYDAITKANTTDELKNLSHLIIACTRKFLEQNKPAKDESLTNAEAKQPIYEDLANWYQELSLKWRRIYFNCDAGNFKNVFEDAIDLQKELCIIKDEFALNEMDLLGSYDIDNLLRFKNRAQELEQYIVHEIECHGIRLNKYNTIEEFLVKNT